MSFTNNQHKTTEPYSDRRLLETFSSIDFDLKHLKQLSFDCFFKINHSLKTNRKKAEELISDVLRIYELIKESGNPETLKKIQEDIAEVKDGFSGLAAEIEDTIVTLDHVKTDVGLMYSPFRFIKQNMVKLDELLSEIKLTNVFKDRSFKSFTEEEALKIHAVIQKVKNNSPVFEENIYNIEKHLENINAELTELKNFFTEEFPETLHQLNDFINSVSIRNKQISRKQEDTENQVIALRSLAGSIIENLEYRNLINTRLNHIQETQKMVVYDLYHSSVKGGQNFGNVLYQEIAKINNTQTERLLFTNKEFKDSVNHISRIVFQVSEKMEMIIKPLNENDDHPLLNSVSGKYGVDFDEFLKKSSSKVDDFQRITKDIALVYNIFNMLFNKFKELEQIENAVEQKVIDRIGSGDLLISEDEKTAFRAQQIFTCYADNHLEKYLLCNLFNQCIREFKELIEKRSISLFAKKGPDFTREKLEVLIKDYNGLQHKLFDEENLKRHVFSKNADFITNCKTEAEKLTGYNFPQSILKNVIEKFDNINMIVKKTRPKMLQSKLQRSIENESVNISITAR
jgi:hypothetical protein